MIWNRRELVANALAALIAPRTLPALAAVPFAPEHPSLIPSTPAQPASYFCTWAVQNYIYGDGKQTLDIARLQGDSGAQLARDAMDAQHLLGLDGWAATFHPRARQDLRILLDDGWEMDGMASFRLDTQKFSSFQGNAKERLRGLNRALTAYGWAGAGLWCRNTPGGPADRDLLRRSADAGIGYWKIDLGDPAFDLVRFRNQLQASLTLEHVHGEPPLNGNWGEDGRFELQRWDSSRIRILRNTDVYRTYDVTCMLSLPTTLDRVAQMMLGAQGHPELHSLLNVEDEVYVAAVLGCTAGVLRHPLRGLRPDGDVDLFFNGPRQAKRRMDEVVRAMRWQRIAPPFPPGRNTVRLDATILTDSWIFNPNETWRRDIVGLTVRQGAPAAITRGLPLPVVHASGERPFIFAARFPNGAIAVGVQERTLSSQAWFMPPCQVILDVEDAPGPFGIFGHFAELTLILRSSARNKRILAQDLAGDVSFDITGKIRMGRTHLTLPGELLETCGLHAASAGDLSSPGLVIRII